MMNVNVRETMPSSATEDAWQSLKDDSTLKALPIAPLIFGGMGAATGMGGRLHDDEGNWDPNVSGNARFQDPFTGGLMWDKDMGDSNLARGAGFVSGAAQGVNPATWLGWGGKGLKAARGAKALRAGDTAMDAQRAAHIASMNQKAMREAVLANVANKPLRQVGNVTNVTPPSLVLPKSYSITPRSMKPVRLTGNHPAAGKIVRPSRYARGAPAGPEGTKMIEAASAAERNARYGAKTLPQRALSAAGRSKVARLGGRLTQLAGQYDTHFGDKGKNILALTTKPLFDNFLQEAGPMQFGGEGGTGGDLGMGTGGGYGEDSGWGTPNDWIYADDNLTGGAKEFAGQKEYGEIKMSENMKIGERMLKEAKDAMYAQDMAKGSCPNCGDKMAKTGCMKMGCGGMEKADKKPAHGMVIVIGSKAGPGPSKDGKREKVDSEKKD